VVGSLTCILNEKARENMKIGLNATCFTGRSSGASQRFKGLYTEVFRRLRDTEFVVYEPCDCAIHSWFDQHENVRFVRTPLKSENRVQKIIAGAQFWQNTARHERFDWFESFNLPIINSPSGRNILTIHDVRDIKLPETDVLGSGFEASLVFRMLYRLILNDSVKKAHNIIAVSNTARDEIASYYPKASISVVYNGVDVSAFHSVSQAYIADVKSRLKLPNDFILSVGHFERRKNYLKLIEALSGLRKRGQSVNMVIVGNDSGELKTVIKHAIDFGVADQLFVINNLSDFELRAIYRAAMLFVFPSIYEGFGIPILEAMAAEIPIVLSNIAVFKEITEGACYYFDPSDSEDIADAIAYVVSSASEIDRLVRYGSKRVLDFCFSNLSFGIENIYKHST
jgi:glycosyltransferase involved in cell wall biosynthesis